MAQEQMFTEDFDLLSEMADSSQIQDSCSIRNVLKARRLANLLITDDGDLSLDKLSKYSEIMRESTYPLCPERQHDIVRNEHIVHVLELLKGSKELQRLVKHLSRPLSNRIGEDMIRDTLDLPPNQSISDAHVRRACVAAWLTTLRQSLGSCFATAPAILIQQEQPHLFLRDLDEMMSTGRLKRTFGGVEYSVPMSTSWGNGDLKRPILLEREMQLNGHRAFWKSPGLIAALVAVDLIPADIALPEKADKAKEILGDVFKTLKNKAHLIFTSAEELIEQALFLRHDITRHNVEEYQNRPKTMIHSGLLLHTPSKQAFGKGDPILAYLRDLELAKTAFKKYADSALLKVWEFTIASFSEIKFELAKFNFYISLGVNFDDAGGIGEALYKMISGKIDQANNLFKEQETEYENILAQMRYLDGRARTASTENEISWMKMEYQSRQAELYHIEQTRQNAYERASKISKMHEVIIGEFGKRFPDSFQEIYDPEIHDFAAGPFDDSPAGFRLLYKHGRSNPSQWTRIYSLSEFSEALVSFFTLTERDISTLPSMRGIEAELGAVITQLVNHVRSEGFLESAFHRMARAHHVQPIEKPLENLDKIEKKPWVYTSGGSMHTLVSSYFSHDEKPFAYERWVESEIELLVFIIDTLRQAPQHIMKQYLEKSDKSMLMHSPTHAFLLKPGAPLLKQAWQSDLYTYTWIKQNYIEPRVSDLQQLMIQEDMALSLIESLLEEVPHDFRPRFKQLFSHVPYQLSISEFRHHILYTAGSDRGMRSAYGPVLTDQMVDSLLYRMLPFTEFDVALQHVEEVLGSHCANENLSEHIDHLKTPGHRHFISAKEVLDITGTVCSESNHRKEHSRNVLKGVIAEFRKRKLLLPEPILFADTNWLKDYFAFVLNPATQNLEFWSVDFFGISGKPVTSWQMWLNGSRRTPQWGIFSHPQDYQASR